MFTITDFQMIFCTSKSTIEKRIKKITPLFKNFDLKKRKHFYNEQEANFVIKQIGTPPNNEYNRNLAVKHPNLFK